MRGTAIHLPGQKCPAGHLTEHLIMECFLLFSCLIGLIGNNSDIKLGKENVQNRLKKQTNTTLNVLLPTPRRPIE